MKFRLLAAFLLFVMPLYAAMSDSTAIKQARNRWGDLAAIGTIRCQKDKPGCTSTNWTRQVGISSYGCMTDFTVIGSGYNTWDAAFAYADMHPPMIVGPLKNTVNFRGKAVDDFSVTKLDFIIDGTPLNAVITNPPSQMWDVIIPINTTLLSTGLHEVCAVASDAAGNTGRSVAVLFTVDQAAATTIAELRVNPVDLRPSVVAVLSSLLKYLRYTL